MALGAMTVTDKANSEGTLFIDVITFAGDSAYSSGGSAFDAAFKAAVGHDRKIMSAYGYGGNNSVEYIPSTGKLMARAAGGSEASGDLSGSTFRVTVTSR